MRLSNFRFSIMAATFLPIVMLPEDLLGAQELEMIMCGFSFLNSSDP